MSHFVCKTLVSFRKGYTFTSHNSSMVVSLSLIRYFSNDANSPHSFTLSYLINKCGLTPESALIASKIVQFKNPGKPDLILSFFENRGFSKPKISEMITKFPKFLSFNPHKVIFPKVDFFLSKGMSTPDLVKIFTVNPWIFQNSLKDKMVCSFNYLSEVLQSEQGAIETIIRSPRLLNYSPKVGLLPNINILRETGVPDTNISHVLCCYGEPIRRFSPVKFRKIVDEVKEMEFNPLHRIFVVAIMTLGGMTKSTWDKKVEVYKSWGWSDRDITAAFRKFPLCMSYSEDKVMAVMDFYVNKIGLESSVIASCPVLLGFSLKKRLVPRGEVFQFLYSKGLLKLDSKIRNMFKCSDKCFYENYVNCHKEAPHLVTLYEDKLNEAIIEEGRKC